jgi:SAM-dependent methyltransferase
MMCAMQLVRRLSPTRIGLFVALLAVASCKTAHPTSDTRTEAPVATNRDKHGPPNLSEYIEKLQSPERVADLGVDKVIEKLRLSADAEVGDLGCGPGIFSIAFAKACPRGVVFASDVEPGELDALNAKIESQSARNVVPVLASYTDPHFPPGKCDLVFIADTYHHLEDRVAYMRRLQAAFTPNGRLAILEYKPGKLPVGPPPEHKLAAGVMERELSEAGYALIERFDTHPNHDFEIWRVVQPWEKKR